MTPDMMAEGGGVIQSDSPACFANVRGDHLRSAIGAELALACRIQSKYAQTALEIIIKKTITCYIPTTI